MVNQDSRWAPNNRPSGYILGGAPGFAGEQLKKMGLARKIAEASRMGFDFAQIDYEALSEMYEPNLQEQVKHIKDVQRLDVGVHLPVNLDLCIANAFEWKEMHETLVKGAFSAKELIGAKYFLFHTSSRIRPHVTFKVGRQEPRVQQVAFNGQNLGTWIEEVVAGRFKDPKTDAVKKLSVDLKDWFMAKFISVLFHAMGTVGDVGMITYFDRQKSFKEGRKDAEAKYDKMRREAWEKVKKERIDRYTKKIAERIGFLNMNRERLIKKYPNASKEEIEKTLDQADDIRRSKHDLKEDEEKIRILERTQYLEDIVREELFKYEYNDLSINLKFALNEDENPEKKVTDTYKEYQKNAIIKDYTERYDFLSVYNYWKEHGSETDEQVAYRVIAKYMYLVKDPLWMDIVGDYDPDDILWDADRDKVKLEKDNSKLVMDLVHALITAVACKYIEGHLFVKEDPWGMRNLPEAKVTEPTSVYHYVRSANVQIYIETAMPPQGQEGELRIMTATDHVKLAKHLDNGEFISYCVDFEHLTVNYVRVDEDIGKLAEGDGKYITMIHINAPRPIIAAHAPMQLLSHDMYVIYRWMYLMKQKGMANAYFIWEMGRYGVDESAVAFRNLVIELRKGTHFNSLPPEFYGLDRQFEARQLVAMREHALDPLKGLITIPEEEHGILSRAALEKGKAAEWKKGRFR